MLVAGSREAEGGAEGVGVAGVPEPVTYRRSQSGGDAGGWMLEARCWIAEAEEGAEEVGVAGVPEPVGYRRSQSGGDAGSLMKGEEESEEEEEEEDDG